MQSMQWASLRFNQIFIMDVSMKKLSHFLLLLIITICFSGCVKDTADESITTKSFKEDNAYLAESLLVPHKLIYGDVVYKDILYYIASDNSMDGSFILVRVALDDSDVPTLTQLDIPIEVSTKELSEPNMMLAIDLEGNIDILVYQYDTRASFADLASVYWYKFNENGQLLRTLDLSDKIADGFYGISDFLVDEGGTAFIAKDNNIHVITSDGESAFTLSYDGYAASLFLSGQKVGILYGGKTGNVYYTTTIDLASKSFAGFDELDIKDIMHRSVRYDEEADILSFAAYEAVFDYDLTHHTMSRRFSFADVGIITDGYIRAFPLDSDRVLLFDRQPFDQNPYTLIRPMTRDEISAAEASKPDEVTIITVGWIGSRYEGNLIKTIAAYNIANPDKQIELIDYTDGAVQGLMSPTEFNTLFDMATLKLELDIIRNQGPDIVISGNALSWNRYFRLGIFEDLYPYLADDDTFNWADYYEHHIKAYEVEHKLYGISVAESYPDTLIVRQADIGNRTEWNLDEFIAFVDSFDSVQTILSDPTKMAVLDLCLYANGDILVDWNNQNVNFNRDFVTKVLEFANRFIDDDKYHDSIPLDLWAGSGDIKVYRAYDGTGFPGSYHVYSSIMGEPISFIGYPSENGSGIIIRSDFLLSLTAGSQNKEVAWHFISYYIAESLMSKAGYRKRADEAMESEGIWYLDRRFTEPFYWTPFNDNNDIIDVTKTAYFDLLARDVKIRIYDQQLETIIKEEAGIYFGGHKSLDEVVDVIENRITLYVSEMSH